MRSISQDRDSATSHLDKSVISESILNWEPTPRRALADQVTDRLRESILHGQFMPGQHLVEEELSEKLAVSRGPVREALVQLEHEGLVIVRRHRGAFVARLSRAEAEDVHTLRVAMERLASRLAAQRATREDFSALKAAVQTMKHAQTRGLSVQQAADLDMGFHDLIYNSAHHERLLGFWSNLRSQVYILLLTAILNDSDYIQRLAESHALVFDSLCTQNPKLAERIAEDHVMKEFEPIQQSHAFDWDEDTRDDLPQHRETSTTLSGASTPP